MISDLENLVQKPLYVYDIPRPLLESLRYRSSGNPHVFQKPKDAEQAVSLANEQVPEADRASDAGATACQLCGVKVLDVYEQRSHVKSDWHHYNLKQRSIGRPAVKEVEFERLIESLEESLSGSGSSEDSDDTSEHEDGASQTKNGNMLHNLFKKQARIDAANGLRSPQEDDGLRSESHRGGGNAPILWFSCSRLPSSQIFGIYKSLFSKEELNNEEPVSLLRKMQISQHVVSSPRHTSDAAIESPHSQALHTPSSNPSIFMCMIGGGHFAAMVVSLSPTKRKTKGDAVVDAREATILASKTFHRYTTRRKQGGSQSANDNAKGNAHSAGSTLRRYNEMALEQEIRQLLTSWKSLIGDAMLLFVRATGSANRRILFGPYDDQVLRLNDPRMRSFPFNTRRATQAEVLRAFAELTRVKVEHVDEEALAKAAAEAEATALLKAAALEERAQLAAARKPRPRKLTAEEEESILHSNQLQALIKRSKVPGLLAYYKANHITPSFEFHPTTVSNSRTISTPLHLAAALGLSNIVSVLLTKAGLDPSLVNADGKTAYEVSKDRSTRDTFRVARGLLGEDGWEWRETRIGPPLSQDVVEERERQERAAAERAEAARREQEEERLRLQDSQNTNASGAIKSKSTATLLGPSKTAQERREEEMRGMTPEMRMRVEREKRARAAEARFGAAKAIR